MSSNESPADTDQLRERQTQLVTAIAVENDPSKLAEIQQELETVARRLEEKRLR